MALSIPKGLRKQKTEQSPRRCSAAKNPARCRFLRNKKDWGTAMRENFLRMQKFSHFRGGRHSVVLFARECLRRLLDTGPTGPPHFRFACLGRIDLAGAKPSRSPLRPRPRLKINPRRKIRFSRSFGERMRLALPFSAAIAA